jgi:hypothetical protein
MTNWIEIVIRVTGLFYVTLVAHSLHAVFLVAGNTELMEIALGRFGCGCGGAVMAAAAGSIVGTFVVAGHTLGTCVLGMLKGNIPVFGFKHDCFRNGKSVHCSTNDTKNDQQYEHFLHCFFPPY